MNQQPLTVSVFTHDKGRQTLQATPVGVNGLAVICATATGRMVVLEHQASDRRAFWDAWKAFGGHRQGLVWESGEPFGPPKEYCPVAPAGQIGEAVGKGGSLVARLRRAVAAFWRALTTGDVR